MRLFPCNVKLFSFPCLQAEHTYSSVEGVARYLTQVSLPNIIDFQMKTYIDRRLTGAYITYQNDLSH